MAAAEAFERASDYYARAGHLRASEVDAMSAHAERLYPTGSDAFTVLPFPQMGHPWTVRRWAQVLWTLGARWMHAGRADLAELACDLVVDRGEQVQGIVRPAVRLVRAAARQRRGNVEGALEDLLAVEGDPEAHESTRVQARVGRCLGTIVAGGNLDALDVHFLLSDASVTRGLFTAPARVARALLAVGNGAYETALDELDHVVAAGTDDRHLMVDVLMIRAQVLYTLDRGGEAMVVLGTAKRLASGNEFMEVQVRLRRAVLEFEQLDERDLRALATEASSLAVRQPAARSIASAATFLLAWK